jgi:hypothetical protein
MRQRNSPLRWTTLLVGPLLLTGCQSTTTPSSVIDGAVAPILQRAVCANLVPIAGSKADTEPTRRQVRRQNARVEQCPEGSRRKPDLS